MFGELLSNSPLITQNTNSHQQLAERTSGQRLLFYNIIYFYIIKCNMVDKNTSKCTSYVHFLYHTVLHQLFLSKNNHRKTGQ